MQNYVSATLLYGFVRSVSYDYKSSKLYFNNKKGIYEKKEMLLIDKISRITKHTIIAVTIWPLMLCEDITRIECAINGKDPSEYESFHSMIREV